MRWYKFSAATGPAYKYVSGTVCDTPNSVCPVCGRLYLDDTVVPHKLDTGRYFPTLMHVDDWVSYEVFSEQAVEAFSQAKLTGMKVISEFILLDRQGTPLSDVPVRYYAVEINGRVALDEKAMHIKRRNVCPCCGYINWNRERMGDACFDENSWDGSDFCSVTQEGLRRVCTQRVLDVIAKEKLRGIELSYGHDLFRIRKLDLKAHQKMIAADTGYSPCYLRK